MQKSPTSNGVDDQVIRRPRASSHRPANLLHSTSTLVGGTLSGQVLLLIALPVLTRLYSPSDFTQLATYVAVLSLLVVIACGRFDVAIALPRKQREATNLLILSLAICSIFSLLLWLLIGILSQVLRPALFHEWAEYRWLLSLGTWVGGLSSALVYWATRGKGFTTIALSRLFQAVAGISVQIGVGVAASSAIGLLLGHLAGIGAGVLILLWSLYSSAGKALKLVSLRGLRDAARRYRQFPQYSVAESLLNTGGSQIPVILIAALISGPEAGFLFLAMRVLGSPISLLGAAVSQVYLGLAPDAERKGNLTEVTERVLVALARVGLFGLAVATFAGPTLFEIVFGAEWRRAGTLVAWMAPWFFFKLLVSPVSMILHVKMRQGMMLTLTAVGMMLRVGTASIALLHFPAMTSEAYSVASAVYYLILLVVISRIGDIDLRRVWGAAIPMPRLKT